MATPGYRSNNGMKPMRTMQQQRNVDSRAAMNNTYATQDRLGGATKYQKYAPKPGIAVPGAPHNKLTQSQANYAAANTPIKKPGLLSRIHRAANLRQFGKRK